MRYLKLFESFSSDFYKKLEDLEKEYERAKKEHLESTKLKVDQFLFDLTDNWSYKTGQINDFIEEDDPSIWYHLKCNGSEFMNFWESTLDCDENLKSELDLCIRVKIDGYYKIESSSTYRKHQLLHGWLAKLSEMQAYIDEMYNLREDVFGKPENYDYFMITVNVSPM